jgi:hypothetical protein
VPGTYSAAGATAATICPAGTICPTAGTATPTTDPAGYYSAAGSAVATICPIGNYCPVGSGAPTPAPPGKYVSGTGYALAQTCPAGTFCASSGTITPTKDPAGYYSLAGAASATICPAGTYCPIGSAAPIQDTIGFYSPAGSANDIPCPPGASCAGGLLLGSVVQNLLIDPANPGATATIALAGTAIGGSETQTLLLGLPAADSPYQITGFSLGGPGAPQFSLIGLAVNQIVKANQKLGFAVDFTPTGPGPTNATLTIDAAPYGGPDPSFVFALSGSGLPVPEPADLVALLAGLAGLAVARRRGRGSRTPGLPR